MSWTSTKLGDLCKISIGKTPPRKDSQYWDVNKETNNIWLSISDLKNVDSNYYISDSSEYISDQGSALFKPIEKGTLLLSFKLTIGRMAFAAEELRTNEAIAALPIIDKNKIHKKYLFYYLQSIDWNELTRGDVKLKGKTLNKEKLKNIQILYPPLQVQKQIVEKLDVAFADIDKAISVTEKNIENISCLLESFSNKYMFDNRNNFKTALIGDLFDLNTGGTPSKKKSEYFSDGEIPWLVSGDIHQQEIIDCAGRITEEGYKNSSAKYLPINSVLIALNGQGKTRGTVAMLKFKATCNQSLVSIYPKNSTTILPEYLYFNLKNRYSEIRKITGDSGNDRRGLNMPLIRKISFSYPENIEEQSKYIEKSKNLINHINYLNEKYEKKLIDLDNLKNSILNQVFLFELTENAA